jgi:hypothetical protein
MQQHDYAEIERALAAFIEPGQVFEVRLLHHNRKRTDSGYFDHPSHAATAIAGLQEQYAGIYFTPNPVDPDLMARAHNRISPWAQLTTLDTNILRRRWLLIDIDPDRPSGISSTQEQLENALKLGVTVANMLELEGWPRPYVNMSGNGCHLMYHIDEPNTEAVRDAVHTFLKTLNGRFASLGCSLDTTVSNASRIFRIPGTWARKGDNIPARPHRKAHMLMDPFVHTNVSLYQIQKFSHANARYLPAAALKEVGAVKSKGEYPDDEKLWRGLNDHAMRRVREWVPTYFPSAREYKEGYRVASADLGLDYEEDLTIHPLAAWYQILWRIRPRRRNRRSSYTCFAGSRVRYRRRQGESRPSVSRYFKGPSHRV